MQYTFIDRKGTFLVRNPRAQAYLYLPLTDAAGTLLSSISPRLAGDIKKDNDHFLTPPASIEDIQNNLMTRRDFFLRLEGSRTRIARVSEGRRSTFKGSLLCGTLTLSYPRFSIEITSFIPHRIGTEIMKITVTNRHKTPLTFTPTYFMPLYGRSEKNLRDHRHVSSLLNRVDLHRYGIVLKPTMVFNEQKHHCNNTCYFVMAYSDGKRPPAGQFPTLLSFCGEGGSLMRPSAVYDNLDPAQDKIRSHEGKEVCASFRFPAKTIKKGASASYVFIAGISDSKKHISSIFRRLDSLKKVDTALRATKRYWGAVSEFVQFKSHDAGYDGWLKWVSIQPTLRKLFGCSFLPHFDYGKGGRGWRDIWQDALNLLLVDEKNTKTLLSNSFNGVRIDGSNATIITSRGDFISDRNHISRVWMDHGIWPYLTLSEYIHRTGDINILFKETAYFYDHQLKRGRLNRPCRPGSTTRLRTKKGITYKGTILEHLLVQHLTAFFNVGEHNIIRLENGDWNDGLDMAYQRGESVAFSCMYAHNIKEIALLLEPLRRKNKKILVFNELTMLLDTLSKPLNYQSHSGKRRRLDDYLEKTKDGISGKKRALSLNALIADLNKKASWLTGHIRKQEWLTEGFFNGYYDNKGKRVEGTSGGTVRMMLTSQVCALMSGVATETQAASIWRSIKTHLKDKRRGGFRLNTNFTSLYTDLGRAFGFSYGDKENGSFFSHMVILLAYALYGRGLIREGHEVISSLYRMAHAKSACIYPTLPEYFNSQGRGLYPYLTGAASWYIHTLLTQVCGIHWKLGSLYIKPNFIREDFITNTFTVSFTFLQKRFKAHFRVKEPGKGPYRIRHAKLNGAALVCGKDGVVSVPRKRIKELSGRRIHTFTFVLS